MSKTNSSRSFSKFYFTVISIGSLIGVVVAYGLVMYQLVSRAIITDEEYLLSRGYRDVEQCSDPYYKPIARPIPIEEGDEDNQIQEKTPEEIAICEENVRERVFAQRRLSMKETLIGGSIRGTLFLILFITHFPRMRRQDEI